MIALDGTKHFCSRKINCRQCSTPRRRHGILFHAFWVPALVAPNQKEILPMPPEFIAAAGTPLRVPICPIA